MRSPRAIIPWCRASSSPSQSFSRSQISWSTLSTASSIPASASIEERRPGWLSRLPWTGRLGLVLLCLFILLATAGPFFTPDAYVQALASALQSPSTAHWLGTDQLGRDLLARI